MQCLWQNLDCDVPVEEIVPPSAPLLPTPLCSVVVTGAADIGDSLFSKKSVLSVVTAAGQPVLPTPRETAAHCDSPESGTGAACDPVWFGCNVHCGGAVVVG
jgi:hypothetical protein